jgi:hypothetical protein
MDQIVEMLRDLYETTLKPLGTTGLLIGLVGVAAGAALAGYIARQVLIFLVIAVGATLLLDNAGSLPLIDEVRAGIKNLIDRFL